MSDLDLESLICNETLDSILDPFELTEEENRTQQILDSQGWLHTIKRGYNDRATLVHDEIADNSGFTSATPTLSQQYDTDIFDGNNFQLCSNISVRDNLFCSTPKKETNNYGKRIGEHLGGQGRSRCNDVKCMCECEGDMCRTPPYNHCNIVDDVTWQAVHGDATSAAVLEQHTAASGIRVLKKKTKSR
jgi:hypothetical protein